MPTVAAAQPHEAQAEKRSTAAQVRRGLLVGALVVAVLIAWAVINEKSRQSQLEDDLDRTYYCSFTDAGRADPTCP